VRITQQFEVNRPVDVVWDFFQDIPAMSECIAGAELTGRLDGGAVDGDVVDRDAADRDTADRGAAGAGTYTGRVALKLGAMSAAFDGTMRIIPDEPSRSGVLEGRGEDRPGKSRGGITLRYALAPARPTTTAVTIDAELTLTGAVAQFARPAVVNDLSSHLVSEFVRRLEFRLDQAEEADRPTQLVMRPAPVHRTFRDNMLLLRRFLHDRPHYRGRR